MKTLTGRPHLANPLYIKETIQNKTKQNKQTKQKRKTNKQSKKKEGEKHKYTSKPQSGPYMLGQKTRRSIVPKLK